jgi:hypothetical protein
VAGMRTRILCPLIKSNSNDVARNRALELHAEFNGGGVRGRGYGGNSG